jgi:hypothetical protein
MHRRLQESDLRHGEKSGLSFIKAKVIYICKKRMQRRHWHYISAAEFHSPSWPDIRFYCVVFNSHMFNDTEVQLWKWCYHIKIFTLNEANTCVALPNACVRCAHVPSVITTIMDQKLQFFLKRFTNVSCISRSRTGYQVCRILSMNVCGISTLSYWRIKKIFKLGTEMSIKKML